VFYFISPLRARAGTKDWAKVSRVTEQALASVFGQTDQRFRVIMCGHDEPDMQRSFDERFTFITVDFPKPELTGYNDQPGAADKYRKVQRALMEVDTDCTYVMLRDADDFVHRGLVAHAVERAAPHGYLIDRGYSYFEGSTHALEVMNFDQLCGTCAIISSTALNPPRSMDKADKERCPILSMGHHGIGAGMAERGQPLEPVPFPAVLYFRGHGENFSHGRAQPLAQRLISRQYWREAWQNFRYRRRLNHSLRQAFSFPDP